MTILAATDGLAEAPPDILLIMGLFLIGVAIGFCVVFTITIILAILLPRR